MENDQIKGIFELKGKWIQSKVQKAEKRHVNACGQEVMGYTRRSVEGKKAGK